MLEEVVPPGDESQLVDLIDPLPSLLTFSLHPVPVHTYLNLTLRASLSEVRGMIEKNDRIRQW